MNAFLFGVACGLFFAMCWRLALRLLRRTGNDMEARSAWQQDDEA